MEAKSVTSKCRTSMFRAMPPSEASLWSCVLLPRFRIVATTRNAFRANSSAVSIPIPPELPVTTATFCIGLGVYSAENLLTTETQSHLEIDSQDPKLARSVYLSAPYLLKGHSSLLLWRVIHMKNPGLRCLNLTI